MTIKTVGIIGAGLMGNGIAQTCAAAGARCEFEFQRRAPAVVNHPHEAAVAARVIERIVGPGLAMVQEPAMPSEDFAFMLQAKPGCYVWLGTGRGPDTPNVHNPHYDFNDAVIPLGDTPVIYTFTDEAPALATASLLPVIDRLLDRLVTAIAGGQRASGLQASGLQERLDALSLRSPKAGNSCSATLRCGCIRTLPRSTARN